jgi:threonine-phosphate decarboxylase
MHRVRCRFADPAPLFRHGGAAPPSPAVLDFSVSVNPLGPPASVLSVLGANLPAVARYPDPQSRELAERLARVDGVGPGQVVVGNGSTELIYAAARAFLPRRVAIAEPTFTEYLRASLLVGAEVDHWVAEEPDFTPEPFDPGGADLVWLCNPNNPTGRLWPGARTVAAWVEAHPRTVLVVDEAFLPLATAPSESLAQATGRLTNLVVLRSLTKYYALPGLRLGYAVASPGVAARLRAQVPPWSVNALAQAAGLAALDDDDYRRRTAEWLTSEDTRQFEARLASLSGRLRPVRSEANFVLARAEHTTAARLTARLARRGVLVRDASNFVGLDEHWFRIAKRTAGENQRVLDALRQVLVEEDD